MRGSFLHTCDWFNKKADHVRFLLTYWDVSRATTFECGSCLEGEFNLASLLDNKHMLSKMTINIIGKLLVYFKFVLILFFSCPQLLV